MKNLKSGALALTVFSIMIAISCIISSPKLDKFMGEWKRIDKTEKDNYDILQLDGAIVCVNGKDTCAGVYDKNRDALKFYVFGQAGVITYNENTGHMLLNNGQDGEFGRIK